MKTGSASILRILLLSLAAAGGAQAVVAVTGDTLVIGYHTYGSYLPTGSGMLGEDNLVNTPYSLAIGYGNHIDTNDNERGSFALGENNLLVGYFSIVGGSYNEVWDSSSITTGYYNSNNAPCSLMVGTGNFADFDSHKDGIIAGKYSASIPINTPAHLVIGNGTSSVNRANSFIVYANGDVVITKPQGDISMGIYGN